MPSSDTLTTRLDAEFAATRERIRWMREESIRVSAATHTRFETFTRLRERIQELAAPRLKQLQERFPEVKAAPVSSPHGDSLLLRLDSDVAKITVAFSLSHDGDLAKAILDYDLEILPVFVQFDSHARLEVALDSPAYDYDKIGQWFDDRIVGFVHTYLAIQFIRQYQGENMVTDPVTQISFPRAVAQASLEYQGKTYCFLSEETRREFEKDPAPYTPG